MLVATTMFHHVIAWSLLIGQAFAFITWINPKLPLEGEPAPPGSVWPKPASWTNNTSLMTLDPTTFIMTSNLVGCDVIDDATSRYGAIIDLDPVGAVDPDLTQLTELMITVQDVNCDPAYYPYFNMDESYNLEISNSVSVSLTAGSIWGALRGLETFSQLLHLTDTKLYHINQTVINDTPRFPYRGLMIDTARHFLHVSVMLDILDAMSWDKLNVLHWHIVDDQSFPYPSRTYPDLLTKGSYTPYHQYTTGDVITVLQQARLRGIRVIPEFDTPGHTWSWGQAYPELVTPCWGEGEQGGPYVPNPPYHTAAEVINPMEESNFQFMDNFFQEIVDDFPDEYVHLGMDEAYYDCWQSNPNMTTWMAGMNFTEYYEVEQYYDSRLINIVHQKGASLIIWQDPIDNGALVPQDTYVEVWKDWIWREAMYTVTSLGYNALLSAPWYLNYISYGEDWRQYYEVEPHNFTDDQTLWPYVHGGEACIWAEYVDGTNILERLWPRVSAVAERLWSSKSETNTENAKFRLDEHRCRYVRRGFPAQPILNGYCGDYEWDSRARVRHLKT